MNDRGVPWLLSPLVALLGIWIWHKVHVVYPPPPSKTRGENVVAVLGGTGMQGGAAVQHLKRHCSWCSAVRVLTRDKSQRNAIELAKEGCEVIEGVATDLASIKSFLGEANMAFLVTFSDFGNPLEGELEAGKVLTKALMESNVERFVFSGGAETPVPVLNAKWDVEQYMREHLSQTGKEQIYLHTSFFYENFIFKGKSKRIWVENDDTYVISTPLPSDLEIPMISARDIGFIAANILMSSQSFASNPSFDILGDMVSPQKLVRALKKALNTDRVEYRQSSLDDFKDKLDPESFALVKQMYQWYFDSAKTMGNATAQIDETKGLYPNVMDIESWAVTYGVNDVRKTVDVKAL